MKNSCIKKLSSICYGRLYKRILQGAWKTYTAGWSTDDFEEAKNSQSCTSNIGEFEHCEFDDAETMKELLSPVKYLIWEFLQGR